ncbi:MAG: type III pantothenate kinase [Gammaproteobacteria bacterium]|nr:type III pantothenate kinase [Gammaproteobacteria bacterium]
MNLLVDLGNSRLKWAQSAPGIWRTGAAVHAGENMHAVLDAAWGKLARPEKIIMSSVAMADARDALLAWCQRHWSLAPVVIRAQAQQLDVKHCYAQPEMLGADRWAALIAVRGMTQSNACVVDCGTAVTVDALAADGEFRGGAIFPGLQLLRASLLRGTGGIYAAEGKSDSVFGCSTPDAVAGGTLQGLIGAVTRLLEEQMRVLGSGTQVFVTGGDAPLLLPRLKIPAKAVPDLVLQGLARIANTL